MGDKHLQIDTDTYDFGRPPKAAIPNLKQNSFFREFASTIALIFCIYVLVNLTTARFIVDGASMHPNFDTGEFLIVSRMNYFFDQPDYGDILVFHFPGNPENDYVKRVVGLPGDTVQISDTNVYVNNILIDEPYIKERCIPSRCPNNEWTLSAKTYFVMGDNRNNSQDSRTFGPIAKDLIVGEAIARYWPPQQWGIIHQFRFTN